jgi:hypothetical protein
VSFRVYPTRMGEGQHPSSASHELRLVPTDLRISDSDSDKLGSSCESSAGNLRSSGKRAIFFVADRKYLLAGAVRANAYFGCFGFARSAFLGTSAVFP